MSADAGGAVTARQRRNLLAVLLLAGAACPPPAMHHVAHDARGAPPSVQAPPAAVARGAVTYAVYCVGCHGSNGDGHGPFATMLGFSAADLRAPALRSASDAALLARLMHGSPVAVRSRPAALADDLDVDAVAAYLPTLGRVDWDVLRTGRLVFEEACAPCHGAYGRSEGAVAVWIGVPDLLTARERQSDATLARISEAGTGSMPALYSGFDPGERRALIAYIRHLSDGFRVYDTYCAACHGDDGQGLYSQDLVPPATTAPPLGAGPYPRSTILHMLRRERGVMPHFRELEEARLRDVIAYLRVAVFQKHVIVHSEVGIRESAKISTFIPNVRNAKRYPDRRHGFADPARGWQGLCSACCSCALNSDVSVERQNVRGRTGRQTMEVGDEEAHDLVRIDARCPLGHGQLSPGRDGDRRHAGVATHARRELCRRGHAGEFRLRHRQCEG